jgi:hypothetical protein
MYIMTAEELRAFVADVRAEAEAALTRLATVDPEALSPQLRQEYERVRAGWEQLKVMTEDEALVLHEAACLRAGRALTLLALLGGLRSSYGIDDRDDPETAPTMSMSFDRPTIRT